MLQAKSGHTQVHYFDKRISTMLKKQWYNHGDHSKLLSAPHCFPSWQVLEKAQQVVI
jgi:hypothetical protein